MTFTKADQEKAREARKAGVKLPSDPYLRGRVKATPQGLQKLYARCLTGKASPRTRIRAKCLECANWSRQEVRDCGIRTCPLWKGRPYVGKELATGEQEG